MNGFSDIIDLLGVPLIAARLGVPAKRVGGWKFRGSIPGEYWHDLAALAAERGHGEITIDHLARVAARKREAAASETVLRETATGVAS